MGRETLSFPRATPEKKDQRDLKAGAINTFSQKYSRLRRVARKGSEAIEACVLGEKTLPFPRCSRKERIKKTQKQMQ